MSALVSNKNNGREKTRRYFCSILGQTYPNLELIFINDGSKDKTEEIALSYREQLESRNIKYIYEYQENGGQASALNRGLKLFTGEYLVWPDSDDIIVPDSITKKVFFLESNPQYGFCICKSMSFYEGEPDRKGIILEKKETGEKNGFFKDILRIKNVFVPGAYMVRTSVLDKCIKNRDIYTGRGGQNAQILLPVSYEYKCGYIDEVLNYYCIRENSHSHSINESVKIIEQLNNYEKIVLETLKRMDNGAYEKYSLYCKKLYGHMRFGCAIDSGDNNIIKSEYRNLKKLNDIRSKERLIYMKKKLGL